MSKKGDLVEGRMFLNLQRDALALIKYKLMMVIHLECREREHFSKVFPTNLLQ